MDPLNLNKTNTTRFMLAMIFNDDVTYNDILSDHYINSYTSDYYEPENDGYIIIVKSINEEPRRTINNPIRSYQRDTNFIFVYEIPDKYKDDYAYIITGNLTLISPEYKKRLLNFWGEDTIDSDLIDLLTKDKTSNSKIYKYDLYEEMYRVRKIEEDD